MSIARRDKGTHGAVRLERSLPQKPAAPEQGRRPRAVEPPAATDAAGRAAKSDADRRPVKSDAAPARARAAASRSKPGVDDAELRRARRGAQRPVGGSELGDQVPPRTAAGKSRTRAGREEYVRMRLPVAGDRLEVVDSHLVDGPLAQPQSFVGAGAYEISVGDRLLFAAAVPDVGTQRSFVDPQGGDERRGHFVTDRSVFEFDVRVPAHELTRETIGDVRLTLHRIKEPIVAERVDERRLGDQFEKRVRPLAELVGLPDSVLPAAIARRGARTARLSG
jgi:hypothetical protein